jgi:hypothetical protein
MDRKTKILIASLLGRIEVAPEKKYGKADFLDSKLLEAGGFCHLPYPSPLRSTPSTPTCLSVLFLGCNLDATEEIYYNKDPTLSIHPKIIPLYLVCCL